MLDSIRTMVSECKIHIVGDSKRPGKVGDALHQGHEAAFAIV